MSFVFPTISRIATFANTLLGFESRPTALPSKFNGVLQDEEDDCVVICSEEEVLFGLSYAAPVVMETSLSEKELVEELALAMKDEERVHLTEQHLAARLAAAQNLGSALAQRQIADIARLDTARVFAFKRSTPLKYKTITQEEMLAFQTAKAYFDEESKRKHRTPREVYLARQKWNKFKHLRLKGVIVRVK
jgi:hypothetical protein